MIHGGAAWRVGKSFKEMSPILNQMTRCPEKYVDVEKMIGGMLLVNVNSSGAANLMKCTPFCGISAIVEPYGFKLPEQGAIQCRKINLRQKGTTAVTMILIFSSDSLF